MDEPVGLVTLADHFPLGVRDEGRRLDGAGAVVVRRITPREVQVTVLDRRPAQVTLVNVRGQFGGYCTCPEFDEVETCPHLWAALLAAERKELLGIRSDPKAAAMTWRSALLALREGAPPRPRKAPRESEILYIADPAQIRASGEFVVRLATRTRYKSGEWRTPHYCTLSRSAVDALPDFRDRRLLELVFGSRDRAHTYGAYDTVDRIRPTPAQAEIVVSELCRTGRFLLWSPDGSLEPPAPVACDDAGPWTVRLSLEARPDGTSHALWGRLERNGETLDLAQPDLFVPDALVLARGKAAPFRTDADFRWIPLLRRSGPLIVPKSESGKFLEELFTSPGGARGIDLPEELRPAVTSGPPVPRLRLSVPRKEIDKLAARVSFDYGGTVFDLPDERDGLYLPAERRLVRRDPDSEGASVAQLVDLQFRTPSYSLGDPKADFQLVAKRLPKVVPRLVETGWQIEGEKGLFKVPGRFRISVTSTIDWFDLDGGVEYGDAVVPFPRLLAALKSGESFVTLDDGSMGVLPADWLRRRGLVLEAGRSEGDSLRFRPGQALLLDALLEAEKDGRADPTFEQARARLRTFEKIEPRDPPAGFRGTLRPYQQVGLGWLEFLESSGLGGCLADDMGLGKTVQVLAWLEARRPRSHGPALVVVPKSLLFNWTREAERFTPSLKVVQHFGLGRDTGAIEGADLVLTTYGTLRRDAPALKDLRFDVAVLDEAQAIKNAMSATAKAARLIRADHRLALSGTPIENHLGELWSLLEFLNPGMLGRLSVFREAIERGDDPDDAMRRLLARALRPILLRRTKAQVAPELPARTEQTIPVELEPEERKRYDELREHYRSALLGSRSAADFNRRKMHVLEALLRLRQAACHPGLIDKALRGAPSAKLDALLERLREVLDEGHKALVFSQFTSLLSIVKDRLDAEKVAYEYLDGQTTDREARVKRFQEDAACPLFLVSLKAGGLGLNLTAAEYVFLLDPWWNPAVEAQAIDRTHRIGQARAVFAYRLVARDTVEEKVLELQKSKRALADAILGADKSLLADLTREDLALLLS